jgi:hypothetical protein
MGDGNITLTSTAASILINDKLTALKDTVTLNATACSSGDWIWAFSLAAIA